MNPNQQENLLPHHESDQRPLIWRERANIVIRVFPFEFNIAIQDNTGAFRTALANG